VLGGILAGVQRVLAVGGRYPRPLPRDSDIRAHVRNGELDDAATLVIRRLGPDVLRRLRLALPGEAEAGDAFSRWAVNVWQGLADFGWRSSLRTWAHRVARNVALDVRGDAWRRRERPFVTGEVSRVADEVRRSTLERHERRRRALDVICATLSPDERTLLDLRVNRRLRWAEIASALSGGGEPADPAAVMKRFERLKRRLARRARELGLA
jgi:RNA polymerase sigma-70 factor, ECF subfamily